MYCTVLYYTILYYTILYYTILYYTILYYTILLWPSLYYTILTFTAGHVSVRCLGLVALHLVSLLQMFPPFDTSVILSWIRLDSFTCGCSWMRHCLRLHVCDSKSYHRTVVCEKQLREPWPCDPAADTAIQPKICCFQIWCSNQSSYTRSPLEDSRLFGPSPWKILAAADDKKHIWATQPLAKIF